MLEEFPALSTRADQGSLTCHDLVKCIFNLNQTEVCTSPVDRSILVTDVDKCETLCLIGRGVD